jgi:hypothetical protein
MNQKKGGKNFPAFFIYSLPSSIALCAQPKANLTGACPDYFCQNVTENLI